MIRYYINVNNKFKHKNFFLSQIKNKNIFPYGSLIENVPLSFLLKATLASNKFLQTKVFLYKLTLVFP